ncbi:MAG: hypothetical protein F6K04_09480 [Leptolyngbya sp. SIO4C5]|nr:hypothetical protein [Leptolyngbya sp. SIO4C5]
MAPDSTADSPTPLSPEQQAALFAQAVAALKHQKYEAATAILQQLLRGATSRRYQAKAQMGLVRALAGQGDIAAAIAQCQALQHHASPQAQAWAKRTLAELQIQAATAEAVEPPPGQEDLSGFTPLEAEAAPTTPEKASPAPKPTPGDISGFTPLETSASQPSEQDLQSPPIAPTSSTADSFDGSGSLFQYERLNAATGSPPPIQAASTPISAPTVEPQTETSLPAAAPQVPNQTQLPDRLRSPQALSSAKPVDVWLLSAITAIAWVWLSTWLLHRVTLALNSLLALIRWPFNPRPLLFFYHSHPFLVFLFCLGLVLASPWLFDELLKRLYQLKSFSTRQLEVHSHEAVLLLRRVCRQRNWLMPDLKLLPTSIPLCFSYGFSPRYGRLVISQGALEQFSEDELAVLYARELARMGRRDWPLLSGLGLYLQFFYQGYVWLAQQSDRQTAPTWQKLLGVASAICYSLYWLMRKLGLGLARLGTAKSDRAAARLTGNPNGLIRVLLKTARLTATHIQAQQQVPTLLESIDLLTPLSAQVAISQGSFAETLPWSEILAWDMRNPYRHWLTFNQPQPLLGERIQRLSQMAEQEGLKRAIAEVALDSPAVQIKSFSAFYRYWQPLVKQGGPIVGLLIGGALALILWFIGGIASAFNIWQLDWLYQDQSLLQGSLLMGFGIGTLLRINQLFPDISPTRKSSNPDLAALYRRDELLPIDSIRLIVEGQLLGHPGSLNLLGQSLLLKTDQGLIKLHFSTALGPLGYLFRQSQYHPASLIGRSVTVAGWLRRGGLIWCDIERLQTQTGKTIRGQAPIFLTWISTAATLMGIYIIFRGG